MPTLTFLKLSPEKKEKLIQIAYQEFVHHSYENASISRIVAAADMAKGSFYQYFGKEAKKDLYLYLIEQANRKKQEALGTVLRERFTDFFEMFRKMYEAGLKFDLENSLYSRFLTNVSLEKHATELGDLHQLTKKQALEYFTQLLKNEQRKGTVRTDLSVEIIAFVVVQIATGLLDFFHLKHSPDATEHPVAQAEISGVLQQVIEIMQHGLAPPLIRN